MAGRVTKKKLLNLTPSEIGKMKSPELRSLLRGARQLWNSQSSTFEKYSQKVYSPAYDKMQDYYLYHGREKEVTRGGIEFHEIVPENMSHMTLNEMRQEVFRLQEFFDSKTSTVPGARKVTSDMAKRIFGEKRGRPAANLSVDEWRQFWSLYEEYKKQKPSDTQEQSNLVQQALGQMVLQDLDLSGKMPRFGQPALDELKDRVSKRRSVEMNNYDGGGTVYSGKRPY